MIPLISVVSESPVARGLHLGNLLGAESRLNAIRSTVQDLCTRTNVLMSDSLSALRMSDTSFSRSIVSLHMGRCFGTSNVILSRHVIFHGLA